jgi:hypothetical protein
MNAAMPAERFLVFTLGGDSYALAAPQVRECLSLPRLTVLDETAPWVIGAFDLRGELTPVVSVGAWCGAPLEAARRGDLVVVTKVDGHPLGLHADAVLGTEPVLAVPTPRVGSGGQFVVLTGGSARIIVPRALGVAVPSPERTEARGAADGGATGEGLTETLAETRLSAFERDLKPADLCALEQRAARYSGLLHSDRPARTLG